MAMVAWPHKKDNKMKLTKNESLEFVNNCRLGNDLQNEKRMTTDYMRKITSLDGRLLAKYYIDGPHYGLTKLFEILDSQKIAIKKLENKEKWEIELGQKGLRINLYFDVEMQAIDGCDLTPEEMEMAKIAIRDNLDTIPVDGCHYGVTPIAYESVQGQKIKMILSAKNEKLNEKNWQEIMQLIASNIDIAKYIEEEQKDKEVKEKYRAEGRFFDLMVKESME